MRSKERDQDIYRHLAKLFPSPECALDHDSPFQLLIATILSAQCTDERVNLVTKGLFARYPDAQSMSEASIASLETLVKSTGFFRSKAKSLKATSTDIIEKHQGRVPKTMEALTALRGVGRKTANVVLGNIFGINAGIVVDTHVGRLSRRFRWTDQKDAVKVEKDLMSWVPQKDWTVISHRLIMHGRATCKSQRPKCEACSMQHLCPSVML